MIYFCGEIYLKSFTTLGGSMSKEKFYLQTWFIALLCSLSFLVIPLIVGIILVVIQETKRRKENRKIIKMVSENEVNINDLNKNLEKEKALSQSYKAQLDSLGAERYEEVTEKVNEANNVLKDIDDEISRKSSTITQLTIEIERLTQENEKVNKSVTTQQNKLGRMKELYKAVEHAIKNNYSLSDSDSVEFDDICPSVTIKLHCMDIKDLRKAFRDNEKQIKKVLELYASRYNTKANIAIYNLMIIALMAELQNILYNLKYEKLEDAIENVKRMTAKYLEIAGNGNQSIASTLTKFIGEIEYLFINAVKIEYNYYVRKEQAKQEQQALREQMRQEAEERKALEAERKKIEKEEEKFKLEIGKVNEQITNAKDESEIIKLRNRILQLEGHLSDVAVKKHEIANLQNGKAGTVYIISNIGSFGEDVFKIGMTRRLEPQDRVNELGDASVPFKFDVHSFIFSKDAVELESKMHTILTSQRVNKVNLRKEFFRISIDELENLVNEIEPAAEFNKTILAEEFRQSLSSEEGFEVPQVPKAEAE